VVWLNANSKISYPRVFSKDSREVKFVGEGFFDVVKDNKRPFKIITENQEIQVLGTRFNVYDYKPSKESITTLVDGLIKMRSNNSDRFSYVRANEQAVINENTIEVHKVDVRPYIAWMEGFFYFDEASPKNALDQLAHWYDLEIIYADDIPQIKFYGMINRKKSLGSILRILEKSGMKFKVDKVNEQKRLLVF